VSGATLGVLFILFSLLRELIELMMASTLVGRALGVGEAVRGTVVFWLQAVLTVLMYLIGLFLAASVWGVPLPTLWRWTVGFFGDWHFGSVTLSPADALLALGVLVLAIVITRLVQRLLLEKVLPATRFTAGVQHSIAAGTGYLGVTLAVLLGIAALGIDMTNVALLAGALSVGIGFGLRTVASNFISGLVLLFERPVKVGDWVVIGTEEGFVRNINIRSTEIETFEKASVIVPNTDMISNALINWTHRDMYGRVDVRVGVAYGEDPQRVREILLACAHDHPKIVSRHPFEAFVLLQDFGEHRLELELRCFTADVTQRLGIASDLRFDIRRRLREAGIQMPLPQQVVHFAPGTSA
jgi:small-conductance mechanosensitive channel